MSLEYVSTSLSAIPRATPPSKVSGNELNPPMSATASALTVTTIVKTVRLSPAFGASRMPASPAIAPPIAQVIVARRFGDQPSADAARSFSALAEIARPTLRVPGEGPERDREHDRDAQQDEAVLLDDDAPQLAVEAEPLVQRVVADRQELVDLVELRVPELLPGKPLQHDEDTQRRDQAHEGSGVAHEAQDAVLDRDPEQPPRAAPRWESRAPPPSRAARRASRSRRTTRTSRCRRGRS